MKKVLITGAAGFVGYHLVNDLHNNGYNIITTDLVGCVDMNIDLLDKNQVMNLIRETLPDFIVHLAGFSSTHRSWNSPQLTMELNVIATLNLLEAVKHGSPCTRILIIGSSDQYGNAGSDNNRVHEGVVMTPQNPYAISKCTQESVTMAMSRVWNLDIVFTRSFNHIGPAQNKGFVVADFASAIVAIENGADPIIEVGNIESYRDFTDVRDIVSAYRLLLEKGRSSEIYNVGSGNVYKIEEILHKLIHLSMKSNSIQIVIRQDRLRSMEMNRLCCDNTKLVVETTWYPTYTLDQSLQDTMKWWRDKIE